MAPTLPLSHCPLLVRTDFTDDRTWHEICASVRVPSPEGFTANLEFIDDRRFEGLTPEAAAGASPSETRLFVFLADPTTIHHSEHPIVAVDLWSAPGRWFRVMPAAMWGVENNLSIANLSWEDFSASTDADGVFRGFS